jgi:hypothetical protein
MYYNILSKELQSKNTLLGKSMDVINSVIKTLHDEREVNKLIIN